MTSASVRVIVLSCVVSALLMLSQPAYGRIIYKRIPDYDSQSASANYIHSSGSHSHGHATSYHNQVLYSYHPIKIYLDKHGHPV